MINSPIDEQFGGYRLTHLLGRGGMASVYRAVRSGPMGFAKQVAIKRLHASLTEDDALLKALINEARLGGQLKHPNIVEIYEFNKVGDTYYLAMEFVDGWTLDRVIRLARKYDRAVPPEVVLDAAAEICLGLHYAHTLESLDGIEVHLVHRDLKPANIILSREGTAKLMDFGIAKADTNLFKTTVVDTTKGTPHYMSPEQVAGDPDLDPASDLFALGSVLYELATGKVLFRGESLASILFAVARAEVDSQVEEVERWVPGLGPIVARCLKRERTERYADAGELRSEILALRENLDGPWTIKNYLYTLRSEILEEKPTTDGLITAGQLEFAALLEDQTGSVKQREAEIARVRQVADAAIGEMMPLGPTVPEANTIDAYAPTLEIGPDFARLEATLPPTVDTQARLEATAVHPHQFDERGSTKQAIDTAGPEMHFLDGDDDDLELAPRPLSGRLVATMLGLAFLATLAVAAVRFVRDGESDAGNEPVAALGDDATSTTTNPPGDAPSEAAEDPGDDEPIAARTVSKQASPAPSPKAPAPRRTATPSRRAPAPGPAPAPTTRTAPAPPAAAVPRPPPPAPLGVGTLKVKRSTPYSRVYVDEIYRGDAPLPGLELPVGSHEVRLECPGLSTSVRRTVQIEADAVVKVPAYNFHDRSWAP